MFVCRTLSPRTGLGREKELGGIFTPEPCCEVERQGAGSMALSRTEGSPRMSTWLSEVPVSIPSLWSQSQRSEVTHSNGQGKGTQGGLVTPVAIREEGGRCW